MSRKASFRLLLGLAAVVTMFMLLVGTGSAKPPPSAAISIVCDRGVGTATVTVTLKVSLFDQTVVGGPVTFTCGPDSISGLDRVRDKIISSQEPGWISVAGTLTTAAGSGGCFIESAPTLKDSCQINGTGPAVSITVR